MSVTTSQHRRKSVAKPRRKPVVKLIGQDGNVFAILAACREGMLRAKYSVIQIDSFINEAMNCESYDAVLRLVMQRFVVK